MHPILVIDDEWSARLSGYKQFEAVLIEAAPELGIRFDFVKSPEQIVTMTRQNDYSGAIIDVVLSANWPRYSVQNALENLADNIPFALISGTWDVSNAMHIQSALKHKNWRAFLHWRDINPAGDGEIMYAVSSLLAMIYDEAELSRNLRLRQDEPIRIVHLSDVQTGGFDEKNLKLEAVLCADAILEHSNNQPPTFVAFTGDVAEHGTPSQYEKSKEWISYFFERLKLGALPSARLLYVPGNHDVNVSLSAAARVKLSRPATDKPFEMSLSDTTLQPELLSYSYAPFRRFLAQVCDCPMLDSNPDNPAMSWVEARFRHFGVVFYGINTAQPANAYGLPYREVNANGLAEIGVEIAKLENGADRKPLVIGLGHHSPRASAGDDCVSNPQAFEQFFGGKVRTALFLHGHVHEHRFEYTSAEGTRLVRSCATTLTKTGGALPPDALRGFNLLEFTREAGRVQTLEGKSFGWIGRNLVELQRKDKKKYLFEFRGDGMFKEPADKD